MPKITVDDIRENDLIGLQIMELQPCQCRAYPWVHTWGLGKCPGDWTCPDCNRTCSLIATDRATYEGHALFEDGRKLADYMLRDYPGSDCCGAEVEGATMNDINDE